MHRHRLESLIDGAFERRAEITAAQAQPELSDALQHVIDELNAGRLRVAEKIDGVWVTHQWIKKAVLLYFRTHDNHVMEGPGTSWFDKVPMRFEGFTDTQFREAGFRVVPPAVARVGAFIGRDVVLRSVFIGLSSGRTTFCGLL